MMIPLPDHCAWCGAYLQGGATQHAPDCWVPQLAAHVGRPIEAFDREARVFKPLPECECRTCGHVASSHIGGSCFECGRDGCWS